MISAGGSSILWAVPLLGKQSCLSLSRSSHEPIPKTFEPLVTVTAITPVPATNSLSTTMAKIPKLICSKGDNI